MASAAERQFMSRALDLARRGFGKTRPNPMVGALIVKSGRLIAEAYHHKAGSPHAEILAMRKAGTKAKGATLYVTLEPCCHTGRTGPCVDAIIKAGISRVSYCANDPDPRVSGRGGRALRKAGIKVETGLCKQEAEWLNDIYFGYHRLKRPYVIVKSAQTLDGRIASNTGDAKWITSEPARKLGHLYRASVDGIMVGMGTVLADNPSLTVRLTNGDDPYRVVVTSSGKFAPRTKLLNGNSDYKTIIATTKKTATRLGKSKIGSKAIIWEVKQSGKGKIDIGDLLERANEFGLRSLLVEGGSSLATSFFKAGLVDKYLAFVAPRLLGAGVNAIGDLGITKINKSITLKDTSITPVGQDWLITAYPEFGN